MDFKFQLQVAKKAQDELFAKYGDPRDQATYQAKWCVIWNVSKEFSFFPAIRIMINKDFLTKCRTFLRLVQDRGLYKEITKYCGCFEARKSRTTDLLSLHYWAAAIDLNCLIERLGQKHTNWTPAFIQCAIDAGLFWGGNFVHTKDPMHFALLNG